MIGIYRTHPLTKLTLHPTRAALAAHKRVRNTEVKGRRNVGRLAAESRTVEKMEVSLDPSVEPVLKAEEILQILPHRYPFLLVDRVTFMEKEKMIVGFKNVTMNDNFFCGHFPGKPIMPGVLQVEALAQLGGILILSGMDKTAQQNFFFGGVENCRFRKPVIPGDTLVMKVDITKLNKRFGIVKAHGKAYVNGEVVCDTDLTLVVSKS